MVVTLEVASSDDAIMATWTFEGDGEVVVDGFRLRYIPEDAEPRTSPVIAPDRRSFVLRHPGLEEHFRVCLDVLAWERAVVHMECRSFKDESSSIVVGILAGLVFLTPCAVLMAYVFLKDRKLAREYRAVHDGGEDGGEGDMDPEKPGIEEEEEEGEGVVGESRCAFKVVGGASGSVKSATTTTATAATATTANTSTTTTTSIRDEAAQFSHAASASVPRVALVAPVQPRVSLSADVQPAVSTSAGGGGGGEAPRAEQAARAKGEGERDMVATGGQCQPPPRLADEQPQVSSEAERELPSPHGDQGVCNPGFLCSDGDDCRGARRDESTDF